MDRLIDFFRRADTEIKFCLAWLSALGVIFYFTIAKLAGILMAGMVLLILISAIVQSHDEKRARG